MCRHPAGGIGIGGAWGWVGRREYFHMVFADFTTLTLCLLLCNSYTAIVKQVIIICCKTSYLANVLVWMLERHHCKSIAHTMIFPCNSVQFVSNLDVLSLRKGKLLFSSAAIAASTICCSCSTYYLLQMQGCYDYVSINAFAMIQLVYY